jgi:hypothetical protein
VCLNSSKIILGKKWHYYQKNAEKTICLHQPTIFTQIRTCTWISHGIYIITWVLSLFKLLLIVEGCRMTCFCNLFQRLFIYLWDVVSIIGINYLFVGCCLIGIFPYLGPQRFCFLTLWKTNSYHLWINISMLCLIKFEQPLSLFSLQNGV